MHTYSAKDIKDIRLSIINEIEYNHKNDRKDDANRAILLIQKFVRSIYMRKKYTNFKKRAEKVLKSQDTIRITPGRFKIPLYVVQQTMYKKIFGERSWLIYKNIIENVWIPYILFPLWLASTLMSAVYIMTSQKNVLLNNILIILSFPLYFVFYSFLQNKLLRLVFSCLECKFYILMSLFVCILLSDLFRDNRVYNVWFNIFPGILIIPLFDAIPRYMKRSRKMFCIISFTFLIYILILAFYMTIGLIEVKPREFKGVKKINNKDLITFSSLSYCIGLIQTLAMLILKNLIWFIINPHRAVILKSPVLITSINEWKIPKLNKKNKYYVQRKIKHDSINTEINELHVNNLFPLFNTL